MANKIKEDLRDARRNWKNIVRRVKGYERSPNKCPRCGGALKARGAMLRCIRCGIGWMQG